MEKAAKVSKEKEGRKRSVALLREGQGKNVFNTYGQRAGTGGHWAFALEKVLAFKN
ncbi:MAG: hypothetical protein HY842_08605 [Bacteroidetes bacterium]|nr:hypothetical protein [Bacteroidota bacterium]